MKFFQPNFRPTGMTTIILGLWIISACASIQDKEKVPSAQELLQKGIKEGKAGYTITAASAFQQVLEDYPDSKERVKALLLLARTYYSNEEYEEAKFHFQKFVELYPAHKQTDRAYFYKTMSDYKRVDLAQRDQTYTQEALEGFEQFITRFPKSQYLDDARIKKQECETALAKNIFEIGKFYFRTGSYQPAITRFKNLMGKYPNQKFQSEAVFLIAESYYHEQNFSEAQSSYKQFLKKYPQSPFTPKARKRLKALRRNGPYDR
jgi:outer membrane protein assembly factor BamD